MLEYIANKLFSFDEAEVDFYLPQLVNMYIMVHAVAEVVPLLHLLLLLLLLPLPQVVHPYLVARCRSSVDFSLQAAWLLEAYSCDANIPSRRKTQGSRLRNLILSGELVPRELARPTDAWKTSFQGHKLGQVAPRAPAPRPLLATPRPHEFHTQVSVLAPLPTPVRAPRHHGHARSRSDASPLQAGPADALAPGPAPPPPRLALGDLTSGLAFDNGCRCLEGWRGTVAALRGAEGCNPGTCTCAAPRLAPQQEWVRALVSVGQRLGTLTEREAKTQRLLAELSRLNLNLPARVWLPIHARSGPHYVVRVPAQVCTPSLSNPPPLPHSSNT